MIIPIRCITCGHVLADKWERYKAELEKLRASQEKAVNKDESTKVLFDKIRVGEILDKLELTNMCCRRVFLGHVDLIDII